jgi:predicted GNAT family acetyltransferase
MVDFLAFKILGGSGSGNFGHIGRPGEVGGSGDANSAFAVGDKHPTNAQSKSWAKKYSDAYKNDPKFRGAIKASILFAGGGFDLIRSIDRFNKTGEISGPHIYDRLRSDLKSGQRIPISSLAHPLAQYTNPFEPELGTGAIHEDEDDAVAAVAALREAVENAEPSSVPIFRGMSWWKHPNDTVEMCNSFIKWEEEHIVAATSNDERDTRRSRIAGYEKTRGEAEQEGVLVNKVPNLKSGDEIDVGSLVSFTANEHIAEQFSLGNNPGQGSSRSGSRSREEPAFRVMFEVAPGAKGISISRFSKWKQSEVLSMGRFVVDSVIDKTDQEHPRYRSYVVKLKAAPSDMHHNAEIEDFADLLMSVPSLSIEIEGRAATYKTLGGSGSGNFGHSGRPGEVGGSGAESFSADEPRLGEDGSYSLKDGSILKRTPWEDDGGWKKARVVIEKDGVEVGSAAILDSGEEIIIEMIYVSPSFRGVGYGKALVRQIVREANSKGYTKISGESDTQELRNILDKMLGKPKIFGDKDYIKKELSDVTVVHAIPKRLRTLCPTSFHILGGTGSGNFGHDGRPGEVGGSGQGDGDSGNTFTEASVRKYLDMVAEHFGTSRPGWQYATMDHLLAKNGKFYAPRELPKEYKRGKAKLCFENAYKLAEARPDELTYVEGQGFALGGIPIHHAWCVDKQGRVVDPTWDFENTNGYVGVEMDIDYVREVILTKETYGVFDFMDIKKHGKLAPNPIRDGMDKAKLIKTNFKSLGGPGSGNFGHAGRPGEVGGSGDETTSAGSGSLKDTINGSRVMKDEDPKLEAAFKAGRARIVTNAKVKHVRSPYGTNYCHQNVAKMYREGKNEIVTGFYADRNEYDGVIWRPHSWLVDKTGQILETTGNKPTHYAGVKLTMAESKRFVKSGGFL